MQFAQLKRREFITLLGAAVAWPLAARAQQADRVPRIGVMFGGVENDPEFLTRIAAFRQELQRLGWTDGGNVRIDIRWGTGDTQVVRKMAADLVALSPDVILTTSGNPGMAALQQATRTIPIVSVGATDPVGAGFVASLARPGGNITGFMPFEYGIAAKWLELLKQIDPRVKRAGILRDPANPTGIGVLAAMQGVAPSFGVELTALNVKGANDAESAIADFARGSNGGLILTLSGATIQHRKLIASLAARHKLASVYPYRFFVTDGGLISYGPNSIEPFRGAAGYVDRILKGEKAGDLPVQAPTKYELVINLKAAKALGLDVPLILQQRADEVIE
jgi:putative tryptophan/tyrosine transport system substrate-binding protein